MISELKGLYEAWIAAVAAAIHDVTMRIVPQRRILLVEGDGQTFTMRVTSTGKGALLQQTSFRLLQGQPVPALPPE